MLEDPIVKKCCCVPLRVCLQVWAWFKVVADLISSIYIFAGLLLFCMIHDGDSVSQNRQEYIFIVVLTLLLVDLVFVTVLIAGVLKKRNAFLKIFFYYGIYMMLAEIVLMFVFLVLVLYKIPPADWDGIGLYCAMIVLVGITWIVIDSTMLIILKSEMIKIRNKEQYDFSRIMTSGPVLDSPRALEKYVEKSSEDSGKTENVEEKYVKLLDF